jgi:hypothetical protein
MRDARIDGDDQITVRDHRCSIGEVLLLGPKVIDPASSDLF